MSHSNRALQVPDELFRQIRCTYLDESVPVTLDDLRTVEYGDWQSYINGCMAALLKEAKDKYLHFITQSTRDVTVVV